MGGKQREACVSQVIERVSPFEKSTEQAVIGA